MSTSRRALLGAATALAGASAVNVAAIASSRAASSADAELKALTDRLEIVVRRYIPLRNKSRELGWLTDDLAHERAGYVRNKKGRWDYPPSLSFDYYQYNPGDLVSESLGKYEALKAKRDAMDRRMVELCGDAEIETGWHAIEQQEEAVSRELDALRDRITPLVAECDPVVGMRAAALLSLTDVYWIMSGPIEELDLGDAAARRMLDAIARFVGLDLSFASAAVS